MWIRHVIERWGGSMEVRLKKEWLGHPSGDIVKVTNDCANTLFQRDAAEQMEPESNGEIKHKIRDMVAEKTAKSLRKLGKPANQSSSGSREEKVTQ
jgi:hypothetical protein